MDGTKALHHQRAIEPLSETRLSLACPCPVAYSSRFLRCRDQTSVSRVRGVGEWNEDEAETLEEYGRINAEARRALTVPFRRDPFEGRAMTYSVGSTRKKAGRSGASPLVHGPTLPIPPALLLCHSNGGSLQRVPARPVFSSSTSSRLLD